MSSVERIVGSGPRVQPRDEEAFGGVVVNANSEIAKELRKWEQHYSELMPRGSNFTPGNPYVYRPYPRTLFKARLGRGGKPACLYGAPDIYAFEKPELFERAIQEMEAFNKSCVKIVDDESQERLAKGQGWCSSPQEALAQFEREQQAIGNASAEAAFSAARMSEPARNEFNAAGTDTHEHVVDIQPKKRGRKPKAIAASGEVDR